MLRSIPAVALAVFALALPSAPASAAPVNYRFGEVGVIEPTTFFTLPDFVTTETTLLPGDFTVIRSDPSVGNYSRILLQPDCAPTYAISPCDGLAFIGPIRTEGPSEGEPDFIVYWTLPEGAYTTPGTYLLPFFSFQIPFVVTDLGAPTATVPEPVGVGLAGLGLAALVATRRRRPRS